MDAEKRYRLLFNQITDALAALDEMNIGAARQILIRAQQDAEEMYLSEADAPETAVCPKTSD